MSAVRDKSLPTWAPFFSGAVGGAFGCLLTCPLEVVKTRLQSRLTAKPTGDLIVRSKILDCILYIQKTEGIRGLWRGIGPTLFGVIPHRSVYFASYDALKSLFNNTSIAGTSYVHLISGFLAGAISSSVMNPVWLVKTRLQLQTNNNPIAATTNRSMVNYASAFDAIKRIHAEEGIKGFYKGLSASYLGNLEGAVQFAMYEYLKKKFQERFLHEPGYAHLFLMASFGKFCACISIYPHEVLRTRLREQRQPENGKPHKYHNIFQATRIIAREEGIRALYQGMGVHMLRSIPNTAIIFVTYEIMTKFLSEWW
eukprot:TRINITY_DN8054_c0_g1_i1.p1 TRINITY_DN8054_c0_g1~~TRINITY_DN8054_c0_g1_i1.p1  ORF type:complete len:311 (+),score=52.66 TRINITY_DN8054_c0_g1_i1:43-975(+)